MFVRRVKVKVYRSIVVVMSLSCLTVWQYKDPESGQYLLPRLVQACLVWPLFIHVDGYLGSAKYIQSPVYELHLTHTLAIFLSSS
jgi:hypothetical protein